MNYVTSARSYRVEIAWLTVPNTHTEDQAQLLWLLVPPHCSAWSSAWKEPEEPGKFTSSSIALEKWQSSLQSTTTPFYLKFRNQRILAVVKVQDGTAFSCKKALNSSLRKNVHALKMAGLFLLGTPWVSVNLTRFQDSVNLRKCSPHIRHIPQPITHRNCIKSVRSKRQFQSIAQNPPETTDGEATVVSVETGWRNKERSNTITYSTRHLSRK